MSVTARVNTLKVKDPVTGNYYGTMVMSNDSIDDINDIASAVASMAELGTDDSLRVRGMAADAEATGNAIDRAMALLRSEIGSPLVATAAEDMTDTEKVYVYTGSESGYVSGNWYYYDGTSWSSGGVYNAVAVETDDTLTQEGKAADSKATGDALTNVSNAINQNEESIADTQSMIATVEATTTASKNYAVGDLLVYDGKLYEVTSAIATGATIIVGSNVTQTTVEEQLGSGDGGGSDWTSAEVTVSEEVTSVLFDVPLTAKEVYLEYEILRTTTTSNFIWVGSDFGDNNTAVNRIQVPADSVHCIGACNITIGYSFISSYCVNGTRTSVPTGLVSASSGQFWASSGAKGAFTRTGKIGVGLSTGIAAGSKISLRYR